MGAPRHDNNSFFVAAAVAAVAFLTYSARGSAAPLQPNLPLGKRGEGDAEAHWLKDMAKATTP